MHGNSADWSILSELELMQVRTDANGGRLELGIKLSRCGVNEHRAEQAEQRDGGGPGKAVHPSTICTTEVVDGLRCPAFLSSKSMLMAVV